MSDFVPRDILPDLWEEILRRHWTFLETEESIQKLEERKKLEGCLKEFLCVVPHDRKFFLPETAHVLRKSIHDLDDFTAYKAIIGFESISQYANNLFTQPWRKEFRVLKMYSGFFQHEIKSNLIDAEKLFEAMGYRRLSDELLVLDGPICPDQVTNVSRDAMAAYVECQIIKHIYAGLLAMGLSCTWQDVYNYREKCVGGTSQATKGLAYFIQERRLRKDKKLNPENCYATIQHSPQAPKTPLPAAVPQCQNCTNYHMPQAHHMQPHLPNGQCMVHNGGSHCALHPTQTQPGLLYNGMNGSNAKLMSSYPSPNFQQQQAYILASGAQPHMSHSRSLEHYNEPPALLPHRHSFDHQQQGCMAHHYQQPHGHPQNVYESPYDCLDGASMGSSASYVAVPSAVAGANCNLNAAYAHPYNVSGNRYPLPFNISNQLNSHYATPTVTCNGIKGDPYTDNDYATVSKPHTCNYQPQPPLPPTRQISSIPAKDFQSFKQRSFPPDHLIDFDDRAALTSHDFHAQLHSHSFDHDHERMYNQRRNAKRANMNSTYAQPRDVCQYASTSSSQLPTSDDMYGNCVYARPLPRGHRTRAATGQSNMTDKYLTNAEFVQGCVDNNRKMPAELKERVAAVNGGGAGTCARRKLSAHSNERDTSDQSCESVDDFVNVPRERHPRSPTQASKNQDGVGSFESWNYVFQNLERSGYNKDLGERGDLLVQSLDLDSLNLANGPSSGTDKRRSTNIDAKTGRQAINGGEKSRTLEKAPSTEKRESKTSTKQEKSILKQPSAIAGGMKKAKSALKSTGKTATIVVNNNNSSGKGPAESNGTASNANGRRQGTSATRLSSNKQKGPVATQVIVSSPNEWSCRFCTFLNPDSKRICEMCCRSKDFNLETTVSTTPTCV